LKLSNIAIEIIEHRNNLIKNYIFGIEKEDIARRTALFSLYLELLKGIDPKEIKEVIKKRIQQPNSPPIFPYDFSSNIITANSLEIEEEKIPHKNKKFDYIVGNPPFFEIKKDSNKTEHDFLEKYKTEINDKTLTAKQIIGHKQISQCFMLKIKDWAKPNTKFGFVINSSNFYNEKLTDFQKFFFSYYQIKEFYELSKVKNILFKKSKEGVVTIIFNNSPTNNNSFTYYPIDYGLFLDISADTLVIDENKSFQIKQEDILDEKDRLRDYLISNQWDRKLLSKISDNKKLEEYRVEKNFRGLERATNSVVEKHCGISFKELSNKEKNELHEKFASEKYLNLEYNNYYNIPYIHDAEKIKAFKVNSYNGYINEEDIGKENNLRRPIDKELFAGNKIVFNRKGGKNKATFIFYKCYLSTQLYIIKLKDDKLYHLITAILNSDLINYFLSLKYRKRIDGNFTKIDTTAIKNIPIPKYIDEDIKDEIDDISKKLTNGIYEYKGEIADKLNDLICDLYELGYLEKRRIKDFFAENREVNEQDLKEYKKTLKYAIELYFKDDFDIKTYIGKGLPFGLSAAAIYFKNSKNQPTVKKNLQAMINQILKENNNKTLLKMREKIFGDNAIYIIKNNKYQSWTKTKAFEDGQEILRRFK